MGMKQRFLQGRTTASGDLGEHFFFLLGASLEKQSIFFFYFYLLGLANMEQKGKPKEFMMAVPAMPVLSALGELLVFLIKHDCYGPTPATICNCNDAVITALELEVGLSPVKSTEQFYVMATTCEHLSEKHSGMYLPDTCQLPAEDNTL